MANGIIFLLCVLGGVICFAIGYVLRDQKDKPVYIPNDTIEHSGVTPHVHAHDYDASGKLKK
jgi:hypothetical protein